MASYQLRAVVLNFVNFIQTLMNFMILARRVTFISGPPVSLYAGPLGWLWGAPFRALEGRKVIQKIDYLYNNSRYTYVSKSLNPPWPPEQKPREMGFRAAIQSAVAIMNENKSVTVTQELKRLSGPRGDWHQRRFTPREVFGESCTSVNITDVLGVTREVDGDEPFYTSSGSTAEAK